MSARILATPLIAICSFFVLLALSATIARAEVPKLISYGSIVNTKAAVGVAIDQSTNDIFVAGAVELSTASKGRIEKFDASGKLLSPPSPFGESIYTGAAINPTNGDVYVVNNFVEEGVKTVIDTYDPNSGALLSSFTVPNSANGIFGLFSAVQIGTDSAGNVYVPVVPDNEVQEYSSSGALLRSFTGSGTGTLSKPTGVAVDASGDLWIADAQNNRIEELSPTDAVLNEIKSEGVHAVALGPHGEVFADVTNNADFCGSVQPPCDHLIEYSPTGTQLADIGAGEIASNEAVVGIPSMLAVDDSSGLVYVTDSGNNLVWIFGPPQAPTVGSELAAEVSTSEAKLGALVNPGGINTTYRFEYGETDAYGHTTPFPEGNVGESVKSHAVWASANGLAQGTTYHYRVVVTNELGTQYGPDETFTTGTSQAVACPNEQFRGGFSAKLPDCRAYELVTPPNKLSAQPDETSLLGSYDGEGEEKEIIRNLAARSGDRFAYYSLEALPGSVSGGSEYLATRGASGWVPEDVLPRQSYTADRCTRSDTRVDAYSADLSKAIVYDGGDEDAGEGTSQNGLSGCDAEPVEVVVGEPLGFENLLLRNNEDGAYQLINVTPPGITPADAHFDSVSADFSHICFSEKAQLTAAAPAGVENEYEWTAGVVRLVTAGAPADCRTQASAVSSYEASGYRYFVAETVLTGNEANAHHEVAQAGQPNLYLAHAGVTTFIATLSVTTANSCASTQTACSRVTSNGLFFAFTSDKSLTGYENNGALEIYLYSAASNKLACASCNPSGEAPTGVGASLKSEDFVGVMGGDPRYLAEDGQLFFETSEALLPSDTNGQSDVYEYEDGQLRLISSGTSSKGSVFLDASESGDDVFLLTRQQLLPQATNEEALSIYDARVEGGFPEPTSPPPCATADSCRTPVSPQPSLYGAPSSQTFSGVGNLTPTVPVLKVAVRSKKCKKGLVRDKKNKCVKPKRKAKSKKANKASNDRRAKS